MTPMSEEAKLVLLGLIVAVIVAGSAFTVTKLLAAGADREKAAVQAVTEKAQAAADIQSKTWQQKLDDAESAHAVEVSSLANTQLQPVSLVVPKYTLSPSMPASPTTPIPAPAAAAAGQFSCSLVPGSSAEMRDFERAAQADQLAADYRLLYTSWPTVSPPR
jgi:hypothetical protein